MTHSILLNTIRGNPQSRPPFWYMRQAGRVLPSYNALKENYSFWQMMKDPELGAEVTLLPLAGLQVDALILFSDILVIPYAMGMGLDFTDKGPVFENPLSQVQNPLDKLNPDASKLEYIYKIIDKIVDKKPAHIPLIGFCGAPFTVLCYMLQGFSRKSDFPDAVRFMYANRRTTSKLVDEVTELSIEYINRQIDHGIDVFQLFDTHAGLLPFDLYRTLFMPAVNKIGRILKDRKVPFIFFPKGIGYGLRYITPETCDYVSVDWQLAIVEARKLLHKDLGIQGNLDPRILFGSKEDIQNELNSFIRFGSENPNWIFNLGHGFIPGIDYENARFMSDWILKTDWNR